MPARLAASIPTAASSTTMQRDGATASLAAAARKISGSGFPFVTSSAPTNTSKQIGEADRAQHDRDVLPRRRRGDRLTPACGVEPADPCDAAPGSGSRPSASISLRYAASFSSPNRATAPPTDRRRASRAETDRCAARRSRQTARRSGSGRLLPLRRAMRASADRGSRRASRRGPTGRREGDVLEIRTSGGRGEAKNERPRARGQRGRELRVRLRLLCATRPACEGLPGRCSRSCSTQETSSAHPARGSESPAPAPLP